MGRPYIRCQLDENFLYFRFRDCSYSYSQDCRVGENSNDGRLYIMVCKDLIDFKEVKIKINFKKLRKIF